MAGLHRTSPPEISPAVGGGAAVSVGHLAESTPRPTGSARGVTLETGGEGEADDLEWTVCGRVEVEYWSLEWSRRGGEGSPCPKPIDHFLLVH